MPDAHPAATAQMVRTKRSSSGGDSSFSSNADALQGREAQVASSTLGNTAGHSRCLPTFSNIMFASGDWWHHGTVTAEGRRTDALPASRERWFFIVRGLLNGVASESFVGNPTSLICTSTSVFERLVTDVPNVQSAPAAGLARTSVWLRKNFRGNWRLLSLGVSLISRHREKRFKVVGSETVPVWVQASARPTSSCLASCVHESTSLLSNSWTTGEN